MKAIPMLFQTELVQALLDGRKTVTRRKVSEKLVESIRFMGASDIDCENLNFLGLRYAEWKDEKDEIRGPEYLVYCTEYPEEGVIPIGQGPAKKGDLIYVRETWREYSNTDECGCSDHCFCPPNGTPVYLADQSENDAKWRPSIHMPRKHSRLTLKVTDVRIERVQEISEEQAEKEGFVNDLYFAPHPHTGKFGHSAFTYFQEAWSSIYGDWDENPYVWVIEFEVIKKNIDSVIGEVGETA